MCCKFAYSNYNKTKQLIMKKQADTQRKREVVFNILLEAGYVIALFLLATTIYTVFYS